jgi:predicted PurR-regulated permease PerM
MDTSGLTAVGLILALLGFLLFIAVVGWISGIRQSARKIERLVEQQDKYLSSISANVAQLLRLNQRQDGTSKPPEL